MENGRIQNETYEFWKVIAPKKTLPNTTTTSTKDTSNMACS